MAISPISNVSVSRIHKNTSFVGRNNKDLDNDMEGQEFQRPRSNKFASVPVAVLIAMTPSMVNGTEPIKAIPLDNQAVTELMEATSASKNSAEVSTYVMGLEQSSLTPYDSYMKDANILHSVPTTINGNKAATLTFESFAKDSKNTVNFVSLVPKDLTNTAKRVSQYFDHDDAPTVRQLVYHNLGGNGSGDDFCSVRTRQRLYDKDGKQYYMDRDVRITDDAANAIIDLLAGDTKFKNNTSIEFIETKSSVMKSTTVIDPE